MTEKECATPFELENDSFWAKRKVGAKARTMILREL